MSKHAAWHGHGDGFEDPLFKMEGVSADAGLRLFDAAPKAGGRGCDALPGRSLAI